MKNTNRHTWLLLAVLVIVALLVAGCGGGETASDTGADSIGDPAKGRQLYQNGGTAGVPCSSCHTLDGTELVGPSLQGIGDRADTRVEGLNAEEYLRQSIVDPGVHLVEGYEDTMPDTFGEQLSEEDVNDLIAYLLNQ